MKRFRSFLVGLFTLAMGAVLTDVPPTPRVIEFNQHPCQKRVYGKAIAGGLTTGRFCLGLMRTAGRAFQSATNTLDRLLGVPPALARAGFAVMPGSARQDSIGTFISTAHTLAANGLNVNALRTNSLLRKDEWVAIDDAVVQVARGRLQGVDDLRSAGLTRDLGGLGVLIDEYEKVGDMTDAEQSMAGVTEGEEDIPDFALAGVPIPITHKDFRVNVRHLEASRTRGSAIDVTAAQTASRKVAEKLEDTLFNGGDVQITQSGTAYTIAGYTTFTDRLTGSLTGNGWDDSGTRDILADAIAIVSALEANNYYGPFVFYVPQTYMSELRDDYKAESDKTILERILAIDAISAVRVTSKLTGDVVIAVQMTSDVVDLSIGQDVTTVEWETRGGLQMRFKVMAAMAPRLKSDSNGATGIAHYS